MTYDLLITSVRDRADLLLQTLLGMLPKLEPRPARVLVHEDYRDRPADFVPTAETLEIVALRFGIPILHFPCEPGRGLGAAVLRLLESAEGEFIFYGQEDFATLRTIPVGRAIEIAQTHRLNQIRFNKRKTLAIKGQHRPDPADWFRKLEVDFGGQTFCVSDAWYFQAALWRRELALEGFRAVEAARPPSAYFCEPAFNRWLNETLAGDPHLRDPETRLENLRTLIWGPIGEPAFVQHLGGDRRTQVKGAA